MNNDLISREALKKAVDTWDKFGYTAQGKLIRLTEHEDFYVPYVKYQDIVNCIDNAPTVAESCKELQEVASERPQGEYTEEDMKRTIKENFDLGYEMAKNKFGRPQGEWIEYNTACHHYKCDQCNADYNSFMVKPNFCPNCGADMRNNESAN